MHVVVRYSYQPGPDEWTKHVHSVIGPFDSYEKAYAYERAQKVDRWTEYETFTITAPEAQ